MGTIHKFKPPPKNEKQFKGYRPLVSNSPIGRTRSWRKLRSWQRSLIAWALLIAFAACVVGARMWLATIK